MSETTYSVEYSKSGRAKCKKCKGSIAKGDIRMVVMVPAAGPDSFNMSSYYHVACFAVPRKYKHLGAQEFVTEHVTDTSEDQSILNDIEAFAKSMEQATGGGAKTKKGEQEGGDTLMDRVAQVAKEELSKDDGPKKKKAKKDEDEEFRQMVELYKEHHKKKIDDLKDYLRWNKQILAGKKDFVLFKVIDGMIHGRLGTCPLDGGALKFQEGDYEKVVCSGKFDEDNQIRIPCEFTGKRTDAALREKPFHVQEPTEEEKEALTQQRKGAATGKTANLSDAAKELMEAVESMTWDTSSPAGIKQVTDNLVKLVEDQLDLPEGRDPKRLLGPIVMANKDKEPKDVLEEIITKFGFKDDKAAKQEAKEMALASQCANPKNAPLLVAFQELAAMYFKEGNRNAGMSYNKVVTVLKDLKAEVTAGNAMSFCKGKTKIPGIGKGSAEKMQEFMETGSIAKLEEKRALHQ